MLRTAAGVVLVLAVALVAGCGSEGSGPDTSAPADPGGVIDVSGTEPVGEDMAGSVAQLVNCRDWNEATAVEKLATIEDVRSQQNRQDPGLSEIELTDEEAGDLFDTTCEHRYAAGFRLYKLYAQANGFVTLKRALEEE